MDDKSSLKRACEVTWTIQILLQLRFYAARNFLVAKTCETFHGESIKLNVKYQFYEIFQMVFHWVSMEFSYVLPTWHENSMESHIPWNLCEKFHMFSPPWNSIGYKTGTANPADRRLSSYAEIRIYDRPATRKVGSHNSVVCLVMKSILRRVAAHSHYFRGRRR